MTHRQRFVAALAAALFSAAVCIATLAEPQWFELLFDHAPDDGDGSLETVVAVALSALACAACSWVARREWRAVRATDRVVAVADLASPK